MVRNDKRIGCGAGFTLIEILVTLVIIGIVLAMLLPAFNAVQDAAMKVRQKAQFSNIEMGLEGFRADFGDYPESGTEANSGETGYSGAQRLAEALVGRDGFGVHKDTQFRLDGLGAGDVVLYDMTPANRAARRGPYLELESANAVRPNAIFDSTVIGSTGTKTEDEASLVLSDVYGLMKNRLTGGKTGLPVLYYKANTSNYEHRTPLGIPADRYGYEYNIYTLNVNDKILRWGVVAGQTHPLWKGLSIFRNAILNPNFGTDDATARPYRAESFILHSAGADGMYGTGDDVFNFDSGN